MRKTILQERQNCSVEKGAGKNTKYWRNESIFIIGHLAKAIAHGKAIQPLQNGQFGSKIKNAKNMRKTVLREYLSCSVQKTGGKNTKYWRNETSSKIGHLAKAIAFAKWSVWFKNKKCQKPAKNHSRRTLALFCGKNSSKKHQILVFFKMGHREKAIAFAKWSVWVRN